MRLDLSKNGICDDGLVAIAAGTVLSHALYSLYSLYSLTTPTALYCIHCTHSSHPTALTAPTAPTTLTTLSQAWRRTVTYLAWRYGATNSTSHPHENSTTSSRLGESMRLEATRCT
jgi:hypothetical protein